MPSETQGSLKRRAGAAIVEAFQAEGVEHVFGLVGSHVLDVYDALVDTPSIRHISVKHEATASEMADVYGRLTGKPGIVLVTAGPGATNSLSGVAQAYMAASPMLHISGAVATNAVNESFHGVDRNDFLVPMFNDITKWSVAINDVHDIPEILAQAFAIATSGRPGPIHIEIPENLLQGPAAEIPPYRRVAVEPRRLERATLDDMVDLIRQSQRPVIWAGKGVRAAFAHEELRELAELLEAPVIMSVDAAGALADDHPLSTGQVSLYSRIPLQAELTYESDLVIAIGERGGTDHADAIFACIVAPAIGVHDIRKIDRQKSGIYGPSRVPVTGIWLGNEGEGPDPRATGGAVADVKTGLNQLLEALGDQQRPVDAALRERISREKNGVRQYLIDEIRRRYGNRRPMHYLTALEALPEFVDEKLICVGDIGGHNIWNRTVIQSRSPVTYIPEGYWGAMGFGLPGALTAKLVYPDHNVLAVTGDGSFLMASMDFATAIEQRLNPVILILNDRQYGVIAQSQQAMYGRTSEADIACPDFVAFSRAFGGDGMRVEHPEQLREALTRGFASDVIFVIDAICGWDFPRGDFVAASDGFRAQQH